MAKKSAPKALERPPPVPWDSPKARAGMLGELAIAARRWALVADAAALNSPAREEAEAIARTLAHLHRCAEAGDVGGLKLASEGARFRLGPSDPIRSRATDLERLCARVDQLADESPSRGEIDLPTFAEKLVSTVVHRARSPFAKRLLEIGRLHVQRQDEARGMLLTVLRRDRPEDARGVVVAIARAFGMPEKEVRGLFDFARKRERRAT